MEKCLLSSKNMNIYSSDLHRMTMSVGRLGTEGEDIFHEDIVFELSLRTVRV